MAHAPPTTRPAAAADAALPLVEDELDVLAQLLPLERQRIIELGCGDARLVRALLRRWPSCRVAALETDRRQHAKNLESPQDGIVFVAAAAQAIPAPAAAFDIALMLKSLHHVPLDTMAAALDEIARVVRGGGHFYVSEPVYAGPLNDVMRLFHDEGRVRAAAQAALDAAAQGGAWRQVAERRFATPVRFGSFDDFERRMMRPTFADHQLDDALVARVRDAFAPHCDAGGSASFARPLHVRLLQRQ